MPAIAASALLPVAGEAAYPLLTNPYIDAAATSAFAGHGLNHAINEGIDGWGDATMTALEVTPLGRLARPMWDAGKQGLQYTTKAIDNATRYASPSYDLYRTIGETTPSVRVRDPYVNVKGLNGADKSYIKIKSSLENLADAKRGNKNEAYYLFAPKDIDILKLRNARFGNGKAYDGPILGSGSVDGKFVSYGEPWMEFAPGEKTALYEMPIGPRRGPNLMATDFRGNRMDYSVNEAYDAVLRDRQFHQDIKNMELGDILQFKRDNYPDLIGGIPTNIYHANQTVIPNKNWNFDKFLKTPLWKYSEDSASGQVQKELMMKWPETKPLETPTIEWTDAVKSPQITAENAASITPTEGNVIASGYSINLQEALDNPAFDFTPTGVSRTWWDIMSRKKPDLALSRWEKLGKDLDVKNPIYTDRTGAEDAKNIFNSDWYQKRLADRVSNPEEVTSTFNTRIDKTPLLIQDPGTGFGMEAAGKNISKVERGIGLDGKEKVIVDNKILLHPDMVEKTGDYKYFPENYLDDVVKHEELHASSGTGLALPAEVRTNNYEYHMTPKYSRESNPSMYDYMSVDDEQRVRLLKFAELAETKFGGDYNKAFDYVNDHYYTWAKDGISHDVMDLVTNFNKEDVVKSASNILGWLAPILTGATLYGKQE